MTSPCHRVQSSLATSFASTLICPPGGAEQRGLSPANDTACHAMRDACANQGQEDTKEPVWLDERQHSKYVTACRDPGGSKEPSVSPDRPCLVRGIRPQSSKLTFRRTQLPVRSWLAAALVTRH